MFELEGDHRPVGALDKVKDALWSFCAPAFPFIRDAILKFKIVKHDFRQQFLLGVLAPGKTVEGLKAFLETHGFVEHFIAWVDKDEVLGLRKLVTFHHQYHLRVFSDGEVRGHFEFTPESRPFNHLLEIGFEARRDEFLTFLGDWILPSSTQTQT